MFQVCFVFLFFSGKVECALFGEYVDQLKKFMETSGEGMPVLVVQFAKIKIFRGIFIFFDFIFDVGL